jgi:hypothetical protein
MKDDSGPVWKTFVHDDIKPLDSSLEILHVMGQ